MSYEIDNIRIQYSGENDATGYVTGLDFRLDGEFVPRADSWLNVSLLQAREQLIGVEHREVEGRDTEADSTLFSIAETVPRLTD